MSGAKSSSLLKHGSAATRPDLPPAPAPSGWHSLPPPPSVPSRAPAPLTCPRRRRRPGARGRARPGISAPPPPQRAQEAELSSADTTPSAPRSPRNASMIKIPRRAPGAPPGRAGMEEPLPIAGEQGTRTAFCALPFLEERRLPGTGFQSIHIYADRGNFRQCH